MTNLSYFDIFPDAKLSITPKSQDEFSGELNPNNVGDLVSFLCSQKPSINWLNIEHSSLCKRVFVLIFDGLDNSRFCKYRSELPTFSSISKDGFPLIVLAEQRNYLITPAAQTFLGYSTKNKKMKKYSSYEEMLASLNQRYDNGYPIKPGTELPIFTKACRYEYFKMKPLSTEELSSFKELPEKVENSLDIIGIDCEMIKTTQGEEVARLSAVDENGNTIIDEYLKPLGEVEDYRTQFSGITQEMLTETDDKKLLDSDQCCEILARVADKHTIIVGHSLENDLRAMRIIHDRVVDTALLYNTEARYPNKPSLSKLFVRHISKNFRTDSEKGHNSAEDARASMLLAKHALTAEVTAVEAKPQMPRIFTKMIGVGNHQKPEQNQEKQENTEQTQENPEHQDQENQEHQDQENQEHQDQENQEHQDQENQDQDNHENLENKANEIPECFEELKKSNAQINVFGPLFHVNFAGIDDRVNCSVSSSVEEVISNFLNSLEHPNDIPTLTYAYFHSLSRCELVDEEEIEACRIYDDILKKTIEKVPPQSAVIIYTANGNLKRLRSDTSRQRPGHDAKRLTDFTLCRQGLLWAVCKNLGDKIDL
ncbi:hypothetical protein M9Y10_041938 [Tritrichomonas musculus]|uniref:Exonuclease domain-containing protein n=1 Tax=Tritrichomonas musculus TaxID=1915356 RepID=A0ABR2K8V3_9EUKA